MKAGHFIRIQILLVLCLVFVFQKGFAKDVSFDFYGSKFQFPIDVSIEVSYNSPLSNQSIQSFYSKISTASYEPVLDSLLNFKEKNKLNDWVYYQLIRKTAQNISPKAENYYRYTLYKWFFLSKSGYDARLAIARDKIIFYVFNDEDISDIPFFMVEGRKYMCLNYHDYGKIDFEKEVPMPVDVPIAEAKKPFSYKITRLPDFKPEDYSEKDLKFRYGSKAYHFRVKVNEQLSALFNNYPVVDFETYFNIPLSNETYGSLIPLLRKNVQGMGEKKGVDYLMKFTRYAFLYQDDEKIFGKERRFSPEQTLSASYSDCDDRAALFFYLVKEIYNLPMLALHYPTHLTMAVQFKNPVGAPIQYNGKVYSICEPTPQDRDLKIGQVSSELKRSRYEVVYSYEPEGK